MAAVVASSAVYLLTRPDEAPAPAAAEQLAA
jgi:hypothetical protein